MRFRFVSALGHGIGGMWTVRGGRKRIEAKQLKNLRKLVQKVRQDSPYFNKLYAQLPETNLLTIRDLPVTSKVDLMRDFDNWLTDRSLTLARLKEHLDSMDNLGVPIGNYGVFQTSGSSGEPTIIIVPESGIAFLFGLSIARFPKKQLQANKELKEAGAMISITGSGGHYIGVGFDKLRHNLTPPFGRTFTFIPAEQAVGETVKQLNEIERIAEISSYPSMLDILTREQEAGRLRVEPKRIRVAGETFTSELRKRVERAFPSLEFGIVDGYGCTECLFTAFECDYGRKHVHEDWVILEAVDENFQSVPDGELSTTALLTVLPNDVQPIIRYNLGDRLRFYPDPCLCGSPFRSFQVIGRQATVVRVGDITLSSLVLEIAIKHERAQRVQMVQTSEYTFEVRAEVIDHANADQAFREIIQSVNEMFIKNGLKDVKVSRSDAPPQLIGSGKFQAVISLK